MTYNNSEQERSGEEKFSFKVKKMSNNELKDALLEIRKRVSNIIIESISDIDEEMERLLRLEEIYSTELKNRELLEWALHKETDE